MLHACRPQFAAVIAALFVLALAMTLTPAAHADDCPAAYQSYWGATGSGPGQFNRPRAIVTDGAGLLYIVDGQNSRVQVMTTAGVFVTSWGTAGSAPGQFNNPNAIARDASGNLYVADTGNSRIQKFSSSGTYLASIGSHGTAAGQVLNPTGVAVDASGYVYVADTGNYRIHKFAPNGSFDRYWGPGPANLASLGSIVVTASGRVITGDLRNGIMYSYDTEGTLLDSWSGPHLYSRIGQMGVDSQNRIHVPLVEQRGIRVFEAGGVPRVLYADKVDYICYNYGGGVTIAGSDIYIADANRNRIYHFVSQESCPGTPAPWAASEPKILLHVTSPTTKNQCTAAAMPDCRSAVTTGALSTVSGPFHFVYLLATRGPLMALRGIQVGLSYDDDLPGQESDQEGIDVFGWTLCASLQFPSEPPAAWPQPGSGNLITWAECMNTNLNVAGYFYVGAYGAGALRIVPRQLDGLIKVANCNSAETVLTPGDVGAVEFGPDTRQACNPCLTICESGPVAVERTTWSAIKQIR